MSQKLLWVDRSLLHRSFRTSSRDFYSFPTPLDSLYTHGLGQQNTFCLDRDCQRRQAGGEGTRHTKLHEEKSGRPLVRKTRLHNGHSVFVAYPSSFFTRVN